MNGKKHIKLIIINFLVLGLVLSALMTEQVSAVNYNTLLANGIAEKDQVEKIVLLDTLLGRYDIHPIKNSSSESNNFVKFLFDVSKEIQSRPGILPRDVLNEKLYGIGVKNDLDRMCFVSNFEVILGACKNISENVNVDELRTVYEKCCGKLDGMRNGNVAFDHNLKSECDTFIQCYACARRLKYSVGAFNAFFHLGD